MNELSGEYYRDYGGVPAEDDDIDNLNDETFGDSAEVWDEESSVFFMDEDQQKLPDQKQSVLEGYKEEEPDDPAIVIKSKPIPKQTGNIQSDDYNSTHDIWGSPSVLSSSYPPIVQEGSHRVRKDSQSEAETAFYSTDNIKFSKPQAPPPPEPVLKNVPVNAITVEELERQLQGDVNIEKKSKSPTLSQRPTVVSQIDQHKARNNENGSPSARFQGSPSGQGFHGSPSRLGFHQHMYRPEGSRTPKMGMGGPRGYSIAIPNYPMRPSGQPPMMRMPHGPPHSKYGYQGPPPMMFNNGMPPHYNSPFGFDPRSMMPPYMKPPMPAPIAQVNANIVGTNTDPYAGLLTLYDKERLIKIQMIQLHTDEPYTDDYYYTMITLKKKKKQHSSRETDNDDTLMLPAHAKLSSREYTPQQFSGSLGRLTTSSVHKPRQILDIGLKEEHVTQVTETKKYRTTLIVAEEAHQLLLDIDEYKKKIPSLPTDKNDDIEAQIVDSIKQLETLLVTHWSSLITIRKGRSLQIRALPVVNQAVSWEIISKIIENSSSFCKKERADPMNVTALEDLYEYISHRDCETLLELSKLLREQIKHLIRTTFGCTLMCQLIVTLPAQIIITKYELDDETRSMWKEYLEMFNSELKSSKNPAAPYQIIGMELKEALNEYGMHECVQNVTAWFVPKTPVRSES